MKRKGFTLIELLAVIIILGILMLIAIPSVTSYINNSRKNTYVDTVKNLVNGASIKVNSGDTCITANPEITYYINPKCIEMETPYTSPYGKFEESYAIAKYNDSTESFDYYWAGVDEAGYGVKSAIPYKTFSDKSLRSNLSRSDLSIKPINAGKYVIVGDDCTCGETLESDTFVSGKCYNEDEKHIRFVSSLDGYATIYAGSINDVRVELIGMESCKIRLTKWSYRTDSSSTTFLPIEEMSGYISSTDYTLKYQVNMTNSRYLMRFHVETEDD